MIDWDIMGGGIRDKVPLTKNWPGSGWKPTPTVPVVWHSGWDYHPQITIEEQSGSNLENYQVLVELNDTNFDFEDAQSNGEDIRFTSDDSTTLIDYWIEEWDNINKSAKIWVEVPSIPSLGTKVIYMYYGNPSASSASNGTNTFEFFDDCESGVATDKWEAVLGSPSFSYKPILGGIWYGCLDTYHGPMATYTAKHRPMAIYSESQNKTFYVYGNSNYKATIGYYNHSTGKFADPVEVAGLGSGDAHRNPSILIDEDGYIYVFYGSHHTTPCKTKKSTSPYDIRSWESKASIDVHTYPQVWQLKSGEIIHFYRGVGSNEYYRISTDGVNSWSDATDLIDFPSVVYAMTIAESGPYPRKLHITWTENWGNEPRKHFWYAYSDDGGTTWKKKDGTQYALPITKATAEKIFDSGDNYTHSSDIQLDSAGNPYILISTGLGTEPNSWTFKLLKYKDGSWNNYTITTSDHQFDTGALVIINDNDFRAYLPSVATQAGEDGGDIEEWKSTDQGETWTKVQDITTGSLYSHNFVRTVYNSHGDFRVFWSYGDSTNPPSTEDVTLYFYGENQVSAQQNPIGGYALVITDTEVTSSVVRAKSVNLGDMILEANVLPFGTKPSYSTLSIRIDDNGHNYNARANFNDESRIYKFMGGYDWTLLGAGTAKDITNWHTWTIKMHNYNIKFLWDGEELISTSDSDSSIVSGSVGARVANGTMKLRNIRVRKYASPKPLISIPMLSTLPTNMLLAEAGYSLLQEDGNYLLLE